MAKENGKIAPLATHTRSIKTSLRAAERAFGRGLEQLHKAGGQLEVAREHHKQGGDWGYYCREVIGITPQWAGKLIRMYQLHPVESLAPYSSVDEAVNVQNAIPASTGLADEDTQVQDAGDAVPAPTGNTEEAPRVEHPTGATKPSEVPPGETEPGPQLEETVTWDCPECNGTGEWLDDEGNAHECHMCEGRGVILGRPGDVPPEGIEAPGPEADAIRDGFDAPEKEIEMEVTVTAKPKADRKPKKLTKEDKALVEIDTLKTERDALVDKVETLNGEIRDRESRERLLEQQAREVSGDTGVAARLAELSTLQTKLKDSEAARFRLAEDLKDCKRECGNLKRRNTKLAKELQELKAQHNGD